MTRPYRVRTAWTASYPTAIALRAGDPLQLDGRRDSWEGHIWLWAQAQDGRAGWIPNTLVDTTGGRTTARADFDAMELSCAEGERLVGLEHGHGWVLCRNASGRTGWVPERCLVSVSA